MKLRYSPIAHITGSFSQGIDVSVRLPWVYIIAVIQQKLVYVGETYDEEGLIGRLSSHFGAYPRSSLKQTAARHAGVRRLKAPYLICAARLPFSDERILFDATSKKVRLQIEAQLAELVATKFLSEYPGWTLVSSATPSGASLTNHVDTVCNEIYSCFLSGLRVFENISPVNPWNVLLLDYNTVMESTADLDIGSILEDIEIILFEWLIEVLKSHHGERWWSEGVPEQTRIQCVTRREQEGESERLPTEAYLMLIDFKEIVKKNWLVCGSIMEEIAAEQGKEKATSWVTELNEIRKLWAHPVKRMYSPIEPKRGHSLRKLHQKVRQIVGKNSMQKT